MTEGFISFENNDNVLFAWGSFLHVSYRMVREERTVRNENKSNM